MVMLQHPKNHHNPGGEGGGGMYRLLLLNSTLPGFPGSKHTIASAREGICDCGHGGLGQARG